MTDPQRMYRDQPSLSTRPDSILEQHEPPIPSCHWRSERSIR